jgi:hypothetical protein
MVAAEPQLAHVTVWMTAIAVVDLKGVMMTAATLVGALPAVGPLDTTPSVVEAGSRRLARVVRALVAGGCVLSIGGGALIGTGSYVHTMIQGQLVEQQIHFPPAASPGLPVAGYPGLQRYGGQLLDTGPEAKAWADQFMEPHILELSGGQPYGEYSAQAFRSPDDAAMQAISKQMAIGEVQRAVLLSAWGWWTVGTVTSGAGVAVVALGVALLLIGALRSFRPSRRSAAT